MLRMQFLNIQLKWAKKKQCNLPIQTQLSIQLNKSMILNQKFKPLLKWRLKQFHQKLNQHHRSITFNLPNNKSQPILSNLWTRKYQLHSPHKWIMKLLYLIKLATQLSKCQIKKVHLLELKKTLKWIQNNLLKKLQLSKLLLLLLTLLKWLLKQLLLKQLTLNQWHLKPKTFNQLNIKIKILRQQKCKLKQLHLITQQPRKHSLIRLIQKLLNQLICPLNLLLLMLLNKFKMLEQIIIHQFNKNNLQLNPPINKGKQFQWIQN